MNKDMLLMSVDFTAAEILGDVREGLGGRPVVDWGKGERPSSLAGIKYALVWDFDDDLFERMPDLKIIFNAGAGVDKILANPHVPKEVPIVRFVDPTLTTRMSEWICLQCLMHLRRQRQYDAQQRTRKWEDLPQPQASEITVGIMGLGVLGQDAAKKLKMLGFQVTGWSRTKKQIDGIKCFDEKGTEAFLAKSHYLIGLLPYTPQTHHIFNRAVFEKLVTHPVLPSPIFINGGRGGSQNEAEIAACLEDGTLGGVSLDVFETEPLPEESPLWKFNNAVLTPHAASNTDIVALGRHVEKQIQRYEAGNGLEYLVDRSLGY